MEPHPLNLYNNLPGNEAVDALKNEKQSLLKATLIGLDRSSKESVNGFKFNYDNAW